MAKSSGGPKSIPSVPTTEDSKRGNMLRGPIGFPNGRRPVFYNVLRPYYGTYKSPYRPRHRFGRAIYPYQTHIKRWLPLRDFSIKVFAAYCLKDFAEKNLFEVLHRLPFRGVGCFVWRAADGPSEPSNDPSEEDKLPVKNLIKKILFKYRPFKGKIESDLYINGKLAREGVSPLGVMDGSWRFSYPRDRSIYHYRPKFPVMGTEPVN